MKAAKKFASAKTERIGEERIVSRVNLDPLACPPALIGALSARLADLQLAASRFSA